MLRLSDSAPIPVKTVDISPNGLQVISDAPLPFRQQCTLSIDLLHPDVPDVLELDGTVAHCILSGQHGFRIGIRYTGLTHRSKVLIARIVSQAA
jgi:hypothetical protein